MRSTKTGLLRSKGRPEDGGIGAAGDLGVGCDSFGWELIGGWIFGVGRTLMVLVTSPVRLGVDWSRIRDESILSFCRFARGSSGWGLLMG